MRFRQRLSSLLLFLYLLSGFVVALYVFDISLAFSDVATNHALVHVAPPIEPNAADSVSPPPEVDGSFFSSSSSSSSSKRSFISLIAAHLTDVPFAVWLFLTLVFYLQGFCLLLAFTKPNPKQFLTTPLFPLLSRKKFKRDRDALVSVE